ncbi:MAG: argininosuccinate lyase [Planctomycetota bacterium]|jgi:argininosuccinate lyase
MPTLWKQTSALHPTFAALNQCLREDWFLLAHELKLQHAHIAALAEVGVLSEEEHGRITAALQEIQESYLGKDCPESQAEDLHSWLEFEVTQRAGSAGCKIHTARSRNDQVATLIKLYLLDSADSVYDAVDSLIAACSRQASRWADMPAPMQTHAQFAAPGTVGFWFLRFATSFQRSLEALGDARRRWRRFCPLGSGAVAGSSIPIDRGIQARELGFQEPAPNALDATGTRDECLEMLAVLSQLALGFQSIAADVLAFAQTPFRWIKYPKAFGTGSSMMPNKSNPDCMELLRGQSCSIQGAYVELLLQLKGLPSGYNRDLQCCKPVIHRTVNDALMLTEMLTAFVQDLQFDADRLEAALTMGHLGATLSMEQHVRDGVPLREAHHKIAADLDATVSSPTDVLRYKTIGSANPNETKRLAEMMLASRAGVHG